MKNYDHKKIEKKWQKEWEEKGIYKTSDNLNLPKKYILDMFPYPSGEGLHVGHPRGYIATDVYSRMKRMEGFNVLHPMGWDAFGLPAENFAIKNKVHPSVAVDMNVKRFKEQLSIMGVDYDWSREINTTDKEFYKWTQWIFLQMYKKGLAFQSYEPINWCPSCATGLANEDVENDGTCERCGTVVEQKPMRQWVLKITDYANRMLVDLDKLPKWPEGVKEAQRNWIGKSEGAEITFYIENKEFEYEIGNVNVFTTRPDTLFGVSYIALAIDHPIIEHLLKNEISNWYVVYKYIQQVKQEGSFTNNKITGIKLEGVVAKQSFLEDFEVPVYLTNYVLGSYGTGAIMGVPAHDERDFEFAKKYELPIKQVIAPEFGEKHEDKDFSLRPAALGLIKNDKEQVLLQKCFVVNPETGKNSHYEYRLPGGGLNDGETYTEGLIREIEEETGYKFTGNISVCSEAYRYFVSIYGDSIGKKYLSHKKAYLLDFSECKKGQINPEDYESNFEYHWFLFSEAIEITSKNTFFKDDAWLIQQLLEPSFSSYNGFLVNSGEFTGLQNQEAKQKITEFVGGKMKSTYRLKDWVFSRQRYWGEPIPMVFDAEGNVFPVDESELPIVLPEVESYEPTGTGESPLANILDWVNVRGKITDKGTFVQDENGEIFRRETNTMPQWAGSSWYYLRYIDPKNSENLVDKEKEKYWMGAESPAKAGDHPEQGRGVDVYVGGDHATRHLIYARFWHKFLFDIGIVSTEEPFPRLEFLGFILAEDGRKMSKRWKNIVNPDEMVDRFGADAFRLYEMFIGPFESTAPWNTNGLVGTYRFIEKVVNIAESLKESDEQIKIALNKTIKKINEDIENFKFNTAVSSLMIFINDAVKSGIGIEEFKSFLKLLAPFAPHIAEEIWYQLGEKESIHLSSWPKYDPSLLVETEIKIIIQVNGKLRGDLNVPVDSLEEVVKNEALQIPAVLKHLEGQDIKKVIYVKNRLINFVV
jgi:leucyl-tRNA synthetase